MKPRLFYILFLLLPALAQAQETAHVYGKVTGTDQAPIFPANIAIPGTSYGTVTDENGNFELEVPAGEDIVIVFSFIGYRQIRVSRKLSANQRIEINQILEQTSLNLDEVTVMEQYDRTTTITRIDIKTLDMLPNVSGNIESILATLPGVSSQNELSSQYSVRGGNYDENLVYVNDIEIHRPFLIRSSQQEGMSFVNPDLVSSIEFSAGGFESSYGDKMSSVLDINYRRPYEFGGSASLSLLGGSLHLEGASKNRKFTHISGLRYRTTKYLLATLETKGEYNPDFLDFQTLLLYRLNPKWELSFLGNIAFNRFHFVPETRSTDFGTYRNPLNLVIYYEGQEKDKFDAYTGALTLQYRPTDNMTLKLISSAFASDEQENYDILGEYLINELDNRIGSETYGDSILNIGVGAMQDHGRSDLNAFVYTLSHLGTNSSGNNTLKWGAMWRHERIFDRISEWEVIDSTGYFVPYDGEEIILFDATKSKNQLFSNRMNAFIQNTYMIEKDSVRYFLNAGIRGSYWDMNREFFISPRATLSIEPNWKSDVVFRIAAGYYYQPPFYKELRYPDGSLNKSVKAQRSIHFVIGGDLVFSAWDRPFKFTTEIYYKKLDNLIPYKLDNVRIEYAAENIAKGYAVGLDMKIFGEFVPGAASWISFSLMKTEEDIIGDYYFDDEGYTIRPGYYPRPTDQRVMVGIYFRDYFPGNPDYKVHLNLIYGTGLPFSPPGIERYDLIFRMPAYKRVDIGFSKVLKREYSTLKEGNPFRRFKSIWISAEIFNLLDVKNTVSYRWIKTVSSQSGVPGAFAVPNYLTGRRFNLKLTANF
ncbi:MAG TPA: TonB-dependent receptor [Bacteroides sp.]|nr:TonB-dependent receptor [Bacteroides sp.]